MKILICSDGTTSRRKRDSTGRIVGRPVPKPKPRFLVLRKGRQDESHCAKRSTNEAQPLRSQSVALEIIVRAGEPIREILDRTSKTSYDLVVIGAR